MGIESALSLTQQVSNQKHRHSSSVVGIYMPGGMGEGDSGLDQSGLAWMAFNGLTIEAWWKHLFGQMPLSNTVLVEQHFACVEEQWWGHEFQNVLADNRQLSMRK